MEDLENTLIPGLETAKQDLERRLETMAQQIRHARKDLESVNTWFNTLNRCLPTAANPF